MKRLSNTNEKINKPKIPKEKNVIALNWGTSIYFMNLLETFDILTQQEIAKGKPYIYQGNCLNITINYC